MHWLIDRPNPYAPLAEWEKYLEELKKISPQDDEIKRAVKEAEREIQSKK